MVLVELVLLIELERRRERLLSHRAGGPSG